MVKLRKTTEKENRRSKVKLKEVHPIRHQIKIIDPERGPENK